MMDVPEELLLAEDNDPTTLPQLDLPPVPVQNTLPPPAVVAPPPLPIWSADIDLFDRRMQNLGLRRCPTQTWTPADGDCALWATLGDYKTIII